MNRLTHLIALLAAAALLACGGGGTDGNGGGSGGGGGGGGGGADADAGPAAPETDEWDELLEQRELDYSSALRKAALRLTGDLPTLSEIKFVADAVDQKAAYEALVVQYLGDPRFAVQQVSFWKDTFKMGGTTLLDSAGVLAAQLVVEGRPFTELLTATTGTCPTFDAGAATFTPADCENDVPQHAGVLTHPGMNAHFYSNMAFRRVRWVQETFDCTAFPAEVTTPQDVGGASAYTAPWPFDSIAGYASGGAIDFLDASSVTCANCHATMNHLAPLFGYFDEAGNMQGDIQVLNPTEGNPATQLTDWLPEGQTTAWRHQVPAADLPALGQAMAADVEVARCSVARAWNWALGRGDIVDALALVPAETIDAQVQAYTANGHNMKDVIFDVFTSDDFVKF